jgi:hypothetical protein
MSRTIKDLPVAVRLHRGREIAERSQARRASYGALGQGSERSAVKLRQGPRSR